MGEFISHQKDNQDAERLPSRKEVHQRKRKKKKQQKHRKKQFTSLILIRILSILFILIVVGLIAYSIYQKSMS